jgi:predicted nucleic acid-binding protein
MSDSRFFLDTNIVVYAFDKTQPKKGEIAVGLLRRASVGEGAISYQVVQEFFSVAFRRFSTPMTISEAEGALESLLTPLIKVHSSPALFADALRLYGRYSLAWYDSLIVAAALEARCRILYSEDLQAGLRIDNLRIVNPFVSQH